MKKQFRLEKLLEIRIMDERSAAAKLSDIDAKLNQVQQKQALLKKKETQLYSSFADYVQNPGDLGYIQAQLAAIKEEAMVLEDILKKIKNEKADANISYQIALKKRKILENLKEKTLI